MKWKKSNLGIKRNTVKELLISKTIPLKRRSFYILISLFFFSFNLFSQESKNISDFSIGSDFISRYVWRGTNYGGSPSIQPALEYSKGSLAIGVWGAYKTNTSGVQEADLYVSYSIADMLSVTITDYFFPGDISSYNYFDWDSNTTGHILEGSVGFSGPERLPVNILFGYNFYGDSENSLYLEAGYSFSQFDIFVGAGNGFYTVENSGNDIFGIVNLGMSISKDIKVTENFSLPITTSFILNPQNEGVFLVFGISL